jgi:adenylosuccinate synthase
MMKTAYIVIDLGFGDAGKGSIVDYLAHNRDGSAIARFTGGPHAAHHVVRPDGVSHAFCQFGATFKPGVCSHLARGMIVKPENVLYEGIALQGKGMPDPFAQLTIDPGCRVVTSYHAMLCQMKEAARGGKRFGTVGIGAGEAVVESEQSPALALHMGDLYNPQGLQYQLNLHYENMQRQAQALLKDCKPSSQYEAVKAIYDSFMLQVRLKNVLALYRQFVEVLPGALCADREWMQACTRLPGSLILEGAHAALLDRDHGYYPYVAKTDTTANEAMRILTESAFQGQTCTVGVVRALGYRHGPGPFVTEDLHLSERFTEQHNKPNEWQGSPRYGWFDLLAVRHGLQINPPVDALALTLLDQLSSVGAFKVCLSYEYRGRDVQSLDEYFEYIPLPSGRVKISAIRPAFNHRRDTFANLLLDCVPCDWLQFPSGETGIQRFLAFLESPGGLGLPVQILSSGPTRNDKLDRCASAPAD